MNPSIASVNGCIHEDCASMRTSHGFSYIASFSLSLFHYIYPSHTTLPDRQLDHSSTTLDNTSSHQTTTSTPLTDNNHTSTASPSTPSPSPLLTDLYEHLETLLPDNMPAIQKVAMSPPKINVGKATIERLQLAGRLHKETVQRIETKPKPVAAEPAKPKRVKRAAPSLFHKPTRPMTSSTVTANNNNNNDTNTDKGYDLVRPSANLKTYKMTDQQSLRSSRSSAFKSVTVTRKATAPRWLFAPRAEDNSCVKKPELLAELMARNTLEKEREKEALRRELEEEEKENIEP